MPALNTNDLSAQMAKSKKFQVIKQIKERKEKHKQMIVRDLTKVNILPKPKQAAKRRMKQKSSKLLIRLSKRMTLVLMKKMWRKGMKLELLKWKMINLKIS